MAAQARIAFETLRDALVAAGACLTDVVELVTYHINLQGDMASFFAVKDEFFPNDFPAWTAVGVTRARAPGVC